MKHYKVSLTMAVLVLLLALFYIIGRNGEQATTQPDVINSPSWSLTESDNDLNTEPIDEEIEGLSYEIIATDLDTPWSIVRLDNETFLISERGGAIKKILSNGQTSLISRISEVSEGGEGGLLGMVLHPNYDINNYIYIYLSYTNSAGRRLNKVIRATYRDNSIENKETILDNIPGAIYHNGGRIAFGPDGNLYIATGDAQDGNNSQDLNSLAGKVLRLDEDGNILDDNPYGNEVYSYGHRNVQGLAFDNSGQLWATEHGRSGALSGLDELNLIEPGKNYGWPIIEGDEEHEAMIGPIAHSGPDVTWAPSGATYLNGSIYFVGLRGEALYRADISNIKDVVVQKYFQGHFGRLRDVVVGGESSLYMISNNTDGRGEPREGDDKLIKVYVNKLNERD